MNPKEFWRGLDGDEARAEFAQACGTTFHHLRNCIYDSGKQANPAVCVRFERQSKKAVMRWELRPDDWHHIWPELIGMKGAPRINVKA